jgi:aminoglycoside phosphotransferase (APT) family kinase protein
LGAPFYLMEPIRGIILRKDPPADMPFTAETARRLCESFIDNLARLHALDYRVIGLGNLGKPQGYLERQVRGWIGRYHGSRTHDLTQIDRISSWLVEHLPAGGEAALIHNDYKYDNMVLDSTDITKIVGVLDWEMCTIGDPLSDLGTALAYWVNADDPEELQRVRWCPSNYPGSFTRAQLIERYAALTGRDISSIMYYLAFARFKVGTILQQIYYRYQMGLTRDERFALLPEKIRVLMQAALAAIEGGAL